MNREIKLEHRFVKAYGQNFLTDKNLLAAIVADAGIDKTDDVLEIGAGAGALTAPLADAAHRVVSYEIDGKLEPILRRNLQQKDNVELVFGDYLKREQDALTAPYKVVANLPYYITTPILFDLIEGGNEPESITIMVQREVADRLAAPPGKKDYGAVTAAVKLYGDVHFMRTVGREMFTPSPNVDSAVIRIDRSGTFDGCDKRAVSRAIRAAFLMRRKTLVNNLMAAYAFSRTAAEEAVRLTGLSLLIRGETLDCAKFVELSENIKRVSDNTR